jgi:hypothetical protein
MTGGTIISNHAGEGDTGKGDGGGVDVNDGGAFTKSGGSIINNHCAGSGNGTQVYYDDTPPRYRNSDLGEGNNISTADPANWQIEEEAEE